MLQSSRRAFRGGGGLSIVEADERCEDGARSQLNSGVRQPPDSAIILAHLDSFGEYMADQHPNFIQSYFHGTKRSLSIGDLVVPGNDANYGQRKAKYVYASSNLNVAIWGAELAVGDGPGRIYVVEPIGPIENDPNLTDKKFPGNPTNSYRAREGFRVVGEVKDWHGHPSDEIKAARERVDLALKNGAPIIED